MNYFQNWTSRRVVSLMITGVCSGSFSYGQKPSRCTPDPVVITINDSYIDPHTSAPLASRLLSDGRPYVDGAEGVEALLRSCPDETGDATFLIASRKSSRNFKVDLTDAAVYTNDSTPSWANSTITASGGFTIGKVLWNYTPAMALTTYSFTTRFGIYGFPNPNYYFRMVNPTADTPPGSGLFADANNPCMSSMVHVRHIPAIDGIKEKWEVWPDMTPSICTAPTLQPALQVGAILDSRTNWSSVGQFRVPFSITIQRK